ncbi:MAG: hypothetical protein SGCHY_001187 [Lobulomycetales sp.]
MRKLSSFDGYENLMGQVSQLVASAGKGNAAANSGESLVHTHSDGEDSEDSLSLGWDDLEDHSSDELLPFRTDLEHEELPDQLHGLVASSRSGSGLVRSALSNGSAELRDQFHSELEKSSLIIDLSQRLTQHSIGAGGSIANTSAGLTQFIGENVGLISSVISQHHSVTTSNDNPHVHEGGDLEDVANISVAPSAEDDYSRFMPNKHTKLDL